ncbi:hypothetical protein V6N11_063598 [Hibiscus sabdariffa]|uniref:Amino acid transporter transmembrane domain-containing protein n=1 Tax=Hibiscus sabdariffa TaxID=183260 RepID=A0ABR1ZCJ9_9ROSI
MVYETPESDREKAINEWLPITSNRDAKWWYFAFHNVTAMVRAGVLSLPYAMAHLGWGPGVTIMILSWLVTLYTLWQMVEMDEMIPGERFDRYHELGQYAFGEKLGLSIIVPQQLTMDVSSDIVYMVMGGQSLKKFHDLGVQPDVDYSYKAASTSGKVFGFFVGLGEIAFAYASHHVVLEIQATMPSTPEIPSKGPMWKGAIVAYIIMAICYLPVAYRILEIQKLRQRQHPLNIRETHLAYCYSKHLPCIVWLIKCKPKRFSLTWFINWICIILGVLPMVLSPTGGLSSIIVSAKYYRFFS